MSLYTIPERTAFHEWLSQRQDRIVGYPGRTASCPLANWLRHVNKNRRLNVCIRSDKGLILADPDEPTGLFDVMPTWCADFADAFDTLVERGATEGSVALSVLSQLEE
jgi:hypothetical protein